MPRQMQRDEPSGRDTRRVEEKIILGHHAPTRAGGWFRACSARLIQDRTSVSRWTTGYAVVCYLTTDYHPDSLPATRENPQ